MNEVEQYTAETAAAVRTIVAAYDAGEISERECKELMQDMFDARRIEELTDDLNLRSDIYNSMKKLYTATKLILPFI